MSDPAVEAAQRAWKSQLVVGTPVPNEVLPPPPYVLGAREALASMRRIYVSLYQAYMDGDDGTICELLHEMECLIYPSEEL